VAFEPICVALATCSDLSANTLLFFLTPDPMLEFDISLIPGVFLAAFVSALLVRQLKFRGFDGPSQIAALVDMRTDLGPQIHRIIMRRASIRGQIGQVAMAGNDIGGVQRQQFGPALVSFRSFERNTRHQGDRIWQ